MQLHTVNAEWRKCKDSQCLDHNVDPKEIPNLQQIYNHRKNSVYLGKRHRICLFEITRIHKGSAGRLKAAMPSNWIKHILCNKQHQNNSKLSQLLMYVYLCLCVCVCVCLDISPYFCFLNAELQDS